MKNFSNFSIFPGFYATIMDLGPIERSEILPFYIINIIVLQTFNSITLMTAKNVKKYVGPPGPISS